METELQSMNVSSQKNLFEIDVRRKKVCLTCLRQKKHDEESNLWTLGWKKMVEWVTEQRNNRYIVNMLHIQQKALKLSSNPSFKASIGWAQKFMKRHSLALRLKTKISQKLPDDLEEQILSFNRFVVQQRKAHQFELSQIGDWMKHS